MVKSKFPLSVANCNSLGTEHVVGKAREPTGVMRELCVPMGGLQGVRPYIMFPFMAGEARTESRWEQTVSLHCGRMWSQV